MTGNPDDEKKTGLDSLEEQKPHLVSHDGGDSPAVELKVTSEDARENGKDGSELSMAAARRKRTLESFAVKDFYDSAIKIPNTGDSMKLVFRSLLFDPLLLAFVGVPVVFASMEILVKVGCLVAIWFMIGVPSFTSPFGARAFLLKRQKKGEPLNAVETLVVDGSVDDVFARLKEAIRLEKDCVIEKQDDKDREIRLTVRIEKYGARARRNTRITLCQKDDRHVQLTLECESHISSLSTRARFVVGEDWLACRLRRVDFKFLNKLKKRIAKQLARPVSDLEEDSSKMCCQLDGCPCSNLKPFDHPIRTWGVKFTIKFMLVFYVFSRLLDALRAVVPALPQVPDFFLVMAASVIYLMAGLAGVWSVLFHRLFSGMKSITRGVFQVPAWQTILAPSIFNQATLPMLLYLAAFVVGFIFNLPGIREDPKSLISALSGAVIIVLGFSVAPIFLGSVIFLTFFQQVSRFLKSRNASAPNSLLSSIGVSLSIFAPIFVMLWIMDVFGIAAYPFLQLAAYLVAFRVLNNYYGAVRQWIHRDPAVTNAPESASSNVEAGFMKNAFLKCGEILQALNKIHTMKLVTAAIYVSLLVYVADGSLARETAINNSMSGYTSTKERVLVAGEESPKTGKVVKVKHDMPAGALLKPEDLVIESIPPQNEPLDAMNDLKSVVGSHIHSPVAGGDIICESDLEEHKLMQPQDIDKRVPLKPGPTIGVIIALKPIKKGELFSFENTVKMEIEEGSLPAGAVQSQGALMGCVAKADIPYRGMVKNSVVALQIQQKNPESSEGSADSKPE